MQPLRTLILGRLKALQSYFHISEASPLVAAALDHQWVLDLITLQEHSRLEERVIEYLQGCARDGAVFTLVEVGVVPGLFRHRIAAAASERWKVIELDPLLAQLRRAQRNTPIGCVTEPTFLAVAGVGQRMPLRDACADAVMLIFLLHELSKPDRDQIVSEAWRILKPGGSLIAIDFADAASFRGRALLAMFAALGQRHLRAFVRDDIVPVALRSAVESVDRTLFHEGTFQMVVAHKGGGDQPADVILPSV